MKLNGRDQDINILQMAKIPALSRVRSPNNGKVGIKSFARTPGASGLILM